MNIAEKKSLEYSRNTYSVPYSSCIFHAKEEAYYEMLRNKVSSNLLVKIQYVIVISILKCSFRYKKMVIKEKNPSNFRVIFSNRLGLVCLYWQF